MKYGQYLEQNLTPEWRRAYINYKALKKIIKTVNTQPSRFPGRADSSDDDDGEAREDEPHHQDATSAADDASSSPKTQQEDGLPALKGLEALARSSGVPSLRSSQPSTTEDGQDPALLSSSAASPLNRSTDPARSSEPGSPSHGSERGPPLSPALKSSLHGGSGRSLKKVRLDESSTTVVPSSPTLTSERNSSTDNTTVIQRLTPSSFLPPSSIPAPPSTPSATPRAALSPIQGSAAPSLRLSPVARKASTRAPAHLEEILPSLQPAEMKFVEALDAELEKVESFYCAREDEMRRRVDNLKLQCKELAEHRRIYHDNRPETATKLPQAAAAYLTNLKPILPSKSNSRPAKSQSPHMPTNDEEYPLPDPRDAQHYDPEAYKRYKRKLRAAVAEAYKGLEVLKNYRILNLTGFRKALKKFEKASKIHLMDAYNNDRISQRRFSDSYEVDRLIEEVEDLYAARFEHGNKKSARQRLRVQASTRSHHYSMFRSGIMIGLAVPTAIHAIVLSFHADTKAAIPAWPGLLQVYGALYLPVLFALLFFLNLQVWVRYRINYRFIFELDIRTVMDYREFLEIPAFLFFTLSFAFWFSFARVGTSNVAPTTWPLAWFIMTIVLFINPLPVLHRPARYWLIRTLFRVLTPGYSRVEFAAFFLADELNSLIFSLYNIWFLGCAQSKGWPADVFQQCNNYDSWVVVVISILPPLARLLQCLQRWRDSGVTIQLVNAGKYLATIVTFICFYLWRGRGSSQADSSFPAWVVFASITSIYTSAWDLLIDWSVLDPREKLLRHEQIYRGKNYAYYFAMVTNVLIRFIWIGYVDSHGVLNLRLRSFIFYTLEMLRRLQWNFFRIENEMIGNIDQYRVTKELPLPYDLNGMHEDPDSSDGEQDAPQESPTASMHLSQIASSDSRRRPAGRSVRQQNKGTDEEAFD